MPSSTAGPLSKAEVQELQFLKQRVYNLRDLRRRLMNFVGPLKHDLPLAKQRDQIVARVTRMLGQDEIPDGDIDQVRALIEAIANNEAEFRALSGQINTTMAVKVIENRVADLQIRKRCLPEEDPEPLNEAPPCSVHAILSGLPGSSRRH